MKVYERVRAYIDEQGLKQVVIAKKAGISNVIFNAILNGKRTLYADDLRAICLALNVSPETFIDFKSILALFFYAFIYTPSKKPYFMRVLVNTPLPSY